MTMKYKKIAPFVASLLLASCSVSYTSAAVVVAPVVAPSMTFSSSTNNKKAEKHHKTALSEKIDSCFSGCHEGRKSAPRTSQEHSRSRELSFLSKLVLDAMIFVFGDPSEQPIKVEK